ncbi:MAG: D-alanine--D-alanine ligase [Alphaproteobacteria bacterium]|nr:D-alanine--D-alanine ligase [Alphaproteobacteria bacterium]
MPRKIAVLFGGSSPEHDVSVVTAQQVMDAVDPADYDIVPVYADFENRFLVGPRLRDVSTYRPKPSGTAEIGFGWGERGAEIRPVSGAPIPIDCAMPVFHGLYGEDGRVHGLLEWLGIPVTGFSATHSALAMRKDLTKTIAADVGVPVLPHVTADRNKLRNAKAFVAEVRERNIGFPAIVKPVNLGSSIGVGIAHDEDELVQLCAGVLTKDSLVMVEPRVPHLVEYNVALRNDAGTIRLSAIERPKPSTELLDFKEKYLSGGGGAKGSSLPSQGMLSLTRDINPELDEARREAVTRNAVKVFRAFGSRGAPRLDFLCNNETGEIWFNEINPIPGSYGYFLWERAERPLLFPELVAHLVEEALATSLKPFDDPVPQGAWLLPR